MYIFTQRLEMFLHIVTGLTHIRVGEKLNFAQTTIIIHIIIFITFKNVEMKDLR